MNDLWLSDEEILGKEPTWEEEENRKLKTKIFNQEQIIELQENTISYIKGIVDKYIALNIHKTRTIKIPAAVKRYREELNILRKIEKEINEYVKTRKEF